MARVSIKEAAKRLDVAEATIRRRLHRGELAGVQITTPQGFVWLVDVPDGGPSDPNRPDIELSARRSSVEGELEALRELVALLRHELESRNRELEARAREVQELHRLLRATQTVSDQPREPIWEPGV